MATTNIYLNFDRTTESAFRFYQSVFKTEFDGEIGRMKDVPPQEGVPPISEADGELIMHVSLPILGGVRLMGTDILDSMGIKHVQGNNFHISLHPDTRAETETLFAALSEGGVVEMPLQEMFWGDYYGVCVDKFGIGWLFNCASKE